ncbi:MAG: hypothetical protein IJ404_00275 [Clostridia bacterium]|nr:hypothetical protein [Clostridia bacterium]
MKKIINIFVSLLIVIVTFSACRGGVYIDDFVNVKWTCNDFGLQFSYTDDNPEMGVGTLVKDNETIEIICLFSLSKNIEVYDKSNYSSTDSNEVCKALLIGHYEVKDDVAKVTIIEDNLFNGEYLNKVIYLKMTPLT